MFGLGTYEILLIAIVALVVVGPKDLPAVLRTVFNLTRKAQALARDFRRGLDELSRESGVDAVKKDLQAVAKGEFLGDTGDLLEDPLADRKIGGAAASKADPSTGHALPDRTTGGRAMSDGEPDARTDPAAARSEIKSA